MDIIKYITEVFSSDYYIVFISFIGSLAVNLNREHNNKKSISNFLFSYYFIIILYILFSNLIQLNNEIIVMSNYLPLLILLAAHSSKTISIAIFRSDNIMHYLSSVQILSYYFFEVLFTSRLGITYLFALFFLFLKSNFTMLITGFIFLVIQLATQIKNNFEVISFEEIYDSRFNFELKKTISDAKKSEMLELLAFIIYMEDRDFIRREGFVFNPLYIGVRKFLLAIDKYDYGKEYILLSKEDYISKVRFIFKLKYTLNFIIFIWRKIYVFISDVFSVSIKEGLLILKNTFLRGYGTLPQQVVRVSALKNYGTYERNKIRRKVFVEYIYTHYFYKAIRNKYLSRLDSKGILSHVFKFSKDDKNNANIYVKNDILFSYYFVILQSPNSIDELIQSMIYNSRTSKKEEEIRFLWENKYYESSFHIIYNDLYWRIFYPIKQNES